MNSSENHIWIGYTCCHERELALDEEMLLMMGDPRGGIPDTSDGGGTDDEAAMAVILSLLEGEAALTQTSDIPWSLS